MRVSYQNCKRPKYQLLRTYDTISEVNYFFAGHISRAFANPADLLCGSFGFSLDVVRTEAWRRGLMLLATNASPSRNIPVAYLSRHCGLS